MTELLKLTSFFGERDRLGGRFWADVLLDEAATDRTATGILLRATAGFGRHHHLRDDRTLTLSEDTSVMAVLVDTADRLEPLARRLAGQQPRGLLTLERARTAPAEAWPDTLTEAARLSILVGRRDRLRGEPAHVVACRLLQEYGVAGASVLAGVDGLRDGTRQRAGFWARNVDVPTLLLAVGTGASIRAALPALRGLLDDPVLSVERVRVCKRDGTLLARPHPLPDTDAAGRPLWQRLVVHTSESHLHDGRPVHRELVRRLRDAGARGATAVRGIWGFHGDHAPHGDRVLQLGRHVPVVTEAIDRPSRVAALFDVVDELTAEHGLVTSELVPGLLDPPGSPLPLAAYDF